MRIRGVHGLAIVALGCGARSPAPGEPTGSGSAPAASAPGTHLPPAVVQTLHGIPMYVSPVGGLFLFSDEQLQAQEVVAAWARDEGLNVLAPATTSAMFARAARGQHAVTGQACGAPLDPYRAVRRWKSELGARGHIDANVDCDPDCVLQVTLSIGIDNEGGSEFFAAPFDPAKPWKAELATRLHAVVDNGGHNAHGHLNNPVRIAGIPRTGTDDLVADAVPLVELTASELPAATRCVEPVGSESVNLEIGANGKVARCEAPADAQAAVATCLCSALATYEAKKPGTHLRIVAVAPHAEAQSKDHLRIRATVAPVDARAGDIYKPLTSDPAIETWKPADAGLAACFADAVGAQGDLVARVTLDFDRDGKVTKTTVVPTTGTLSPAAQTCVREVLSHTVAPCPGTDAPSATAELKVGFQH